MQCTFCRQRNLQERHKFAESPWQWQWAVQELKCSFLQTIQSSAQKKLRISSEAAVRQESFRMFRNLWPWTGPEFISYRKLSNGQLRSRHWWHSIRGYLQISHLWWYCNVILIPHPSLPPTVLYTQTMHHMAVNPVVANIAATTTCNAEIEIRPVWSQSCVC